MLAPASAASIAAVAMSSGVTGRWGDMEGVWIEPVTAQVTITFEFFAISVQRSAMLHIESQPAVCIMRP
jgi:hypothetical protein